MASLALSGTTFVLTGKMSLARRDITDMISTNGGEVMSSFSKTNPPSYVISTTASFNKGTGKIQDARNCGVPIISDQFLSDSISSGRCANIGDPKYRLYSSSSSSSVSARSSTKKKRASSSSSKVDDDTPRKNGF